MVFLLVTPWQVAYAQQDTENEVTADTETTEDIEDVEETEQMDEIEVTEEDQEQSEIEPEDNSTNEKAPSKELEEDKQEDTKVNTLQSKSPKYADGDEGNHIVKLKQDLVRLGFASWSNPSPTYGPITAGVVRDFQKYYNLKVTGVADKETRDKIEKILNPPYRPGDRGEPVVELKEKLVRLGFASWTNPSIFYGSVTANRVKDFQEAYLLETDGIAGEKTLAKLDQVITEGKFQDGDTGDHIVELKKKLVQLGFATWSNPSPNYGPITAEVVADFQQQYGLTVTGIADDLTRQKVDEILEPPYQIGDRGEPVVELKKQLVELGFATWSNPSPNYGTITANRVKDFQKAFGLKQDGIVDDETLELLYNPSYYDGDSGQHIVDLKKDLVRLGFASWTNPTPNYGSITMRVVEDFQRHFDLPVTGIATKETRDKIKEILNPPYRPGDIGEPVVKLKEKLVKLGYASWSDPSPNYGTNTANRVKDFQRAYGLKVDGIVTKEILEMLDDLVKEGKFQDGDSGEHVKKMKQDLVRLGFADWTNPSPNYGVNTSNRVSDFQEYYGIRVSGVANQMTLNKIDEILNSDFVNGKKSKSIVTLKKDLTRLGFGNFPSNPSESYGLVTESVVSEFQEYYGLVVNGIGDPVTLEKIDEIINSPYRDGQSGSHIVKLKEKLVQLGFASWSNPSPNYGSITADVVSEFQRVYGLKVNGIADEVTLTLIDEIIKNGYIKKTSYNISLDEAVKIQMSATPQTDKKEYAWVSKNYIDKNNIVTASTLNVRTQPTTENVNENKVLGTLSKGTIVEIIGEHGNWYAIKYKNNAWVHAIEEDVRSYLNPNNFINDEKQRFQFLDLSSVSGARAKQLNKYLKGKGILEGKGQAFIDAGRTHGLNEIYLISHAILETGNGTSKLATGVKYNGKTVYNMYGIGAYDSCPVECGSERAYNEGWDTPDKAIIGGAQFIGNNYIKAGLNTIYKMRWNPQAMDENGRYGKQYATDIGWASKQVSTMYNLYKSIELFNLRLDIPVYK